MRSTRTGRIRRWMMRDVTGWQMLLEMREHLVFNDPAPLARAALLGLGVAMLSVPDALPHLVEGALVRLVPKWYADAGPIHLYYAS
jgi:DNA-binding transcriptional LysR family regulator